MAWLSDTLSLIGKRQTPRSAARRVIFINAKLRDGDNWRDVQIGDISETGLMLRTDCPPEVGEVIEVRHRGWSVVGEVVWKNGSRIGLKALAPINDCDLLVSSDIGRRQATAVRG